MTITESTRAGLELRYEREAQAYMKSLPLEHYMEQMPHAHQRKITLESLDLVSARRPEVQVFNELFVQYSTDFGTTILDAGIRLQKQ